MRKQKIGLRLLQAWASKAMLDPDHKAWRVIIENMTPDYAYSSVAMLMHELIHDSMTAEERLAKVIRAFRLLIIYMAVCHGDPKKNA